MNELGAMEGAAISKHIVLVAELETMRTQITTGWKTNNLCYGLAEYLVKLSTNGASG